MMSAARPKREMLSSRRRYQCLPRGLEGLVPHDAREGRAVRDFCLRIRPGEVVALVGESGYGRRRSVNAADQLLRAAMNDVDLSEALRVSRRKTATRRPRTVPERRMRASRHKRIAMSSRNRSRRSIDLLRSAARFGEGSAATIDMYRRAARALMKPSRSWRASSDAQPGTMREQDIASDIRRMRQRANDRNGRRCQCRPSLPDRRRTDDALDDAIDVTIQAQIIALLQAAAGADQGWRVLMSSPTISSVARDCRSYDGVCSMPGQRGGERPSPNFCDDRADALYARSARHIPRSDFGRSEIVPRNQIPGKNAALSIRRRLRVSSALGRHAREEICGPAQGLAFRGAQAARSLLPLARLKRRS